MRKSLLGALGVGITLNLAHADSWNQTSPSGTIVPTSAASNVGIGATTAPAARLQVTGGDILVDNNRYFKAKNSSGAIHNLLGLNTSNVQAFGSTGVTGMQWNVGGTVRLHLNNSGNLGIGIGTGAPGRRLDVMHPNGDGIRALGQSGTESSANLFLEPASTNANKRKWVLSAYGDQFGDFSIRSSTTATGNPYGTSGVTRFLINKDGKVGIGTLVPAGRLEAVSASATDGYAIIASSNQNYMQMLVKATGTGNAGEPLIKFMGQYRMASNDGAEIYQDTNGNLKFNTNGSTNAVNIHPSGNFGIGSPAQSAKLEVNQANVSNPVADFRRGGTSVFRITSGGNVGIGLGETAPNNTLDVGGHAFIRGSVTLSGDGEALGNFYGGSANDFFRIYMDNQNNDGGILHIRTGDNSNEPIYFEQGTDPTPGSTANVRMAIGRNGYVGVATPDPQKPLHVAGEAQIDGQLTVASVKTKVWTVAPDYVFEEDYDLKPLSEVEKFLKKNKHLPEIPSAKEIGEKGIDLAEMNMKLLQKVEELTLHAISQSKEIEALRADIKGLKANRSRSVSP